MKRGMQVGDKFSRLKLIEKIGIEVYSFAIVGR